MGLILGGVTYPLPSPGGGGDITALADPLQAKALAYWQACIDAYIKPAYVAAMAGQATATANQACTLTLPVDPVPWLDSQLLRPPVLAIYPVSGTWGKNALAPYTLEHDTIDYTYHVVYVLPAVTFAQFLRISAFLQAVYEVLVLTTEKQSDPHYNSSEEVWQGVGTSAVYFSEVKFGALESVKTVGHFMPMFQADFHAVLRDRYDESAAVAITSQLIKTGIGEDVGILDDAIEADAQVPLPP